MCVCLMMVFFFFCWLVVRDWQHQQYNGTFNYTNHQVLKLLWLITPWLCSRHTCVQWCVMVNNEPKTCFRFSMTITLAWNFSELVNRAAASLFPCDTRLFISSNARSFALYLSLHNFFFVWFVCIVINNKCK